MLAEGSRLRSLELRADQAWLGRLLSGQSRNAGDKGHEEAD